MYKRLLLYYIRRLFIDWVILLFNISEVNSSKLSSINKTRRYPYFIAIYTFFWDAVKEFLVMTILGHPYALPY
jgi:hypothetical protein